MKAIITGANGFFGSHLVKECLKQQIEVHALLRKNANTSLLPSSDHLTTHTIDYRSSLTPQLSQLKDKIGSVDFFMHNAGLTVSLNNDDYYQVNRELTKTLLDSINESEIIKSGIFVYTSSYAAHGPIGFEAPVSHYGRSKLQAEEAVRKQTSKHLIVRPTAIYGAGDTAFLPLFKSAKKGIYPITNSKQKMTMIHGADLARMVVQDMQTSTGTLHYNDGNTYLHQDFIKVFEDVYQKKIRTIPLPSWLAKFSIGASDIWNKLLKKRPGITLEKFEEISQDWNLQDLNISHSSVNAPTSLREGFDDALNFYKRNNLI